MYQPMRAFIFLAFSILIFFGCRKDSFTDNPATFLQTTSDTLHFDTVFTSTGSTTQFVKIVNDNNKGIRIASVRLAGGNTSSFRINVDGIPGPEVRNLEVPAHDSLYVFVTVTIDPGAANLAFLVRDSIEIDYNGNKKWVQLDAYGQNARFLKNHTISTDETWNNDLPYVVIGNLNINEGVKLTIQKGSRIYLHANAPVIVKGTLQVLGERWDSTRVIFTGDRLDLPYRDFPASWPGIVLTTTSKDNEFRFATIRNAYQGIIVQDPAPGTAPKLLLRECIIDNAYEEGILAINSSIRAENVLVSNCGKNILLAKGGNYQFTHCTVTTVPNGLVQHKDPVLLAANFINQNNSIVTSNLNAVFRNCIFWGEQNGIVENEVVVLRNNAAGMNVVFDQVLWRQQVSGALPAGVTVMGEINQMNPEFDTLNSAEKIYSFRLKESSPAREKGMATPIIIDLDGNPRPFGLPDLGAYEWKP
jgi:hypothetical protein